MEHVKKHPFGKEEYDKMVVEFGGRKTVKKMKLIEQLQRQLFVAQITDNKESLSWIEKILVQLLGYSDMLVRDQAVILLNMLYDGVDWQLGTGFQPVIRCVGQHFKVSLTVSLENWSSGTGQMFMGLSAPSPLSSTHETVLTWHKIVPRNIIASSDTEAEIQINFGKFWKCGFYDWRLILINGEGKLRTLSLTKPPVIHNFPIQRHRSTSMSNDLGYDEDDPYDADLLMAQGRFIVHSRGMRDHCFHEI